MKLPSEVPVMVLPNATLFPQALLPLYIFEPRYRQMLLESLHSNRLLSVAMQKPGRTRETPSPIAGLGLIRVSVGHKDGTSHLILQGLARVQLAETVRYKPYRIQRIRPLESPPCNDVVVDALLAKVRELLEERVTLGIPLPFLELPKSQPVDAPPAFSPKDIFEYLDKLNDPEQITDWVSSQVLRGPVEQQTILETVHLEARLKHLIHFLMAEITRQRKDKKR
ncbi:MAG: peptidase lon domain protein [Pedosphaera sp.]|nr:peptidase lon domain protein [Pedosphaera sp.]